MKKKNNYWIESPFKVQEDPTGFLTMDYENLIEISSDIQLKTKFEGLLIAIFWCSIFDKISKFIIQVLIVYYNIFMWICGLSQYVSTKTINIIIDWMLHLDKQFRLSNREANLQKILEAAKH